MAEYNRLANLNNNVYQNAHPRVVQTNQKYPSLQQMFHSYPLDSGFLMHLATFSNN